MNEWMHIRCSFMVYAIVYMSALKACKRKLKKLVANSDLPKIFTTTADVFCPHVVTSH